jgi:hypothetical protein
VAYSVKRGYSLVARPGRLARDSRALVALDAMCGPSSPTTRTRLVQVLDGTNRLGIDRSGNTRGKEKDMMFNYRGGVAESCLAGRARVAGGPWSITDT